MDKRYQVFISSTYSDLKEERGKVMQTIMSLDCIPAGMELFPAMDIEQFNFIKRIIDDCDYYILMIGGRYGSMDVDGISYTEKEYDYAVSKGIPVLAFLHNDINNLPVAKSDIDADKRSKLEAFREKVATGRLVRFWSNPDELNGQVAVSLTMTIKTYPAIGWVRANLQTNAESLQEMNDLRKELAILKQYKSEQEKTPATIENIASLDEKIELHGKYSTHGFWDLTLTWKDLFSLISPFFLEYQNDDQARSIIARILAKQAKGEEPIFYSIDSQDFQTIKIQMMALGLMDISNRKLVKGGQRLCWVLTEVGIRFMKDLRVIRTLNKD